VSKSQRNPDDSGPDRSERAVGWSSTAWHGPESSGFFCAQGGGHAPGLDQALEEDARLTDLGKPSYPKGMDLVLAVRILQAAVGDCHCRSRKARSRASAWRVSVRPTSCRRRTRPSPRHCQKPDGEIGRNRVFGQQSGQQWDNRKYMQLGALQLTTRRRWTAKWTTNGQPMDSRWTQTRI